MFLVLEFDSEVPIYLQIRNKIIEGIAKDEIKEGDKLPSVRELASGVEVNLHTVNKAYNLLKEEGFVTVDRRKGVIVNIKRAKDDIEFKEKYKIKLNEIAAEGTAKGMNREEIIYLLNKVLDCYEGGK
ncbi:GntR family transcriptional regulator [Eubacterium multiforme]|uniref:DNA-binding transcriptional regulator YhcF (GntR family) n=1 Tax=Eubacterium multiforme TaxID=83339 RepID=A0ABT9USY3_9FIRM|nr:GntR family transcriptional regulator [Eubacterium multiforme]MDQ0149396.1 DNA-binding transcriptional regulator YhcF (GntR family) [Eubacterium multiforme]